MFQTWWSKLLVVATLVAGLAVPVAAASFSDVSESDWYYDELDMLVERGIVSGYEDGTFRPSNSVTVGEVAKMLYIYQKDESLANGASHWAENYADGIYNLTWVDSVPTDLNAGATRVQVIEMVLESMGFLADSYIDSPFVDMDNDAANTLYDMGIINGTLVEGVLCLNGDAIITRAEFCAILDRVETYMTTEYGVSDFRYQQPEVTRPGDPSFTFDYFYEMFLYMIVTQEDTVALTFTDMTDVEVRAAGKEVALAAFWQAQADYHEIGAFYDCLSQDWDYDEQDTTTWTMQISNTNFTAADAKAYQTAFVLGIPYYAQQISDDGMVTSGMSDYEIAKYLYQFMALNFAYDYSFQPINHNGYGMLSNGVGICQSYVSVYNALCKMFGVDIVGVAGTTSGENHIWSYANLDGEWVYIDPTWGDSYYDGITANMDYFAVSYATLSQTHTFDG